MGRHTAAVTHSNRRPLVIVFAVLLVLGVAGTLIVRAVGSAADDGGFIASGNCTAKTDVKLSTTPEMRPQLEAAAKSLLGRDDSRAPCATFKISAVEPAVVASALAAGADERPDLWVPDSTLWVARADDGQSVPTVVVPSIASSPLVLVGSESTFANTGSWLAAFQNTPPSLLDPLTTATGATALLAVQSERAKTSMSDADVDRVLVPLAQRHGAMGRAYTDIQALLNRAAPKDSGLLVPASEQSFVTFQEKHPDTGLRAIVPDTGTLALDYPIVVTAKEDSDKVSEAARLLVQEMQSDSALQARDEAGFRPPTLDQLGAGRGVGPVEVLGKPQAQVAEEALQQWTTYALSAHSLAVIDVSGSMAARVGNKSRMDLTIEAAEAGLELFPDNSQLGLWVFSTRRNGSSTDWTSLVPIRRLDEKVGGKSQRREMTDQLRSMRTKLGGGTGLYDTAVAAYRTVQDSFDPRAINAVMIFTDGRNDDGNSISLDEAIRTLKQLRDPARPVRIIAIGIGPDADRDELQQLARATGGRDYLAKDPADIKAVFIDALRNR
jgi:Bacterial extracellular solute-binding protein/von Willebrand factor type A domain